METAAERPPMAQTGLDVDAIRRADSGLKAFAYLPKEIAIPKMDGPLRGVSVGVKDIIDTADMPTGYGSAIDPGHRPGEDAWIVKQLKGAGAAIVGKTHTTEFAWRHPGPTVNPHDARHTPGGSSSGSAAAVAAGLVDLALGTQTVGSVIRPAAYCGVVGFKPSYGWTPRTGVHPLSWTLDHLGLFASDVATVTRAFEACLGKDPSDAHGYVPGIEPRATRDAYRIGVVTPPGWGRVSTEQKEVRDAVSAKLEAGGFDMVEMSLPEAFADILDAGDAILKAEACAIYSEIIQMHPDRTSDWLKSLVAAGKEVSAEDYTRSLLLRSTLRDAFTACMREARVDAVLTVPALDVAPEGLDDTGDASMCAPWTTIGAPAICLPAAHGERNLPLGVQLVSPWLDDVTLLSVARRAEQAIGDPRRNPPA